MEEAAATVSATLGASVTCGASGTCALKVTLWSLAPGWLPVPASHTICGSAAAEQLMRR